MELVGEKSRHSLHENMHLISTPLQVIWGKNDQVQIHFIRTAECVSQLQVLNCEIIRILRKKVRLWVNISEFWLFQIFFYFFLRIVSLSHNRKLLILRILRQKSDCEIVYHNLYFFSQIVSLYHRFQIFSDFFSIFSEL